MKKLTLILLGLTLILSACSTTKKCDGGNKIKTEMW